METDECAIKHRFYDVLSSRRSVRRYLPSAVDDETIRRVIGAALFAPSAHNRQPWRFVVIRKPEQKTVLAHAMGTSLRRDRLADGDNADDVEQDVQRSFNRISSAPVLILLCLTMEVMDIYPDECRRKTEHLMAVQSVAMAAQNLLLAIDAEGLGACWMCAPLFCQGAVRATLELSETWHPQALITAGWPAAPGKKRERLTIDDVTVFL